MTTFLCNIFKTIFLFYSIIFSINANAEDLQLPFGLRFNQTYGKIFLENKISYHNITQAVSSDVILKDVQNIINKHSNLDYIVIPFELEYKTNNTYVKKHCRVLLLDTKSKKIIVIGSSQKRFNDHQNILSFISSQVDYVLINIITHEQKPGMCKNATQLHMQLLAQGVKYLDLKKHIPKEMNATILKI